MIDDIVRCHTYNIMRNVKYFPVFFLSKFHSIITNSLIFGNFRLQAFYMLILSNKARQCIPRDRNQNPFPEFSCILKVVMYLPGTM